MTASTPDIIITRTFDAPREKVWKAWTEPEYMKQWWGPKDFSCPTAIIDFRVGGKYLSCMRGAPGPGMPIQDFWSTGNYKEIVPMEKIVCTDHFADEKGNIISPAEVGMPGKWPEEMLVTIALEDAGIGKTKMTLHHIGHPPEIMEMATMGWNQSFDKLAKSL